MQIDILIEGKKKTFVAEIVPMLAKRRFQEIQVKEEELIEENGKVSPKEFIEHENEIMDILVSTVFKNQFTVDELLDGVTEDYYDEKIREVLFGKTVIDPDEESGNEVGK